MRWLKAKTAAVLFACASSQALAADLPAPVAPDPAVAFDDGLLYAGLIEVWGGWTFPKASAGPPVEDTPAIGGSGRYNIPLGDRFSVQLDADGEYLFADGYGTRFGYNYSAMAYGHLSWRNPESYLFGVFGGVGVSQVRDDDAIYPYVVGVEAQAYFNHLTLYGQGGFFTTDSNSSQNNPDGIRNAFFIRGVGRYFFSDNARLEGEVTYANGDIDYAATSDSSDPMWAWGLRYEQMAGFSTPAAWFLGYRGSWAENQSDRDHYHDHTVMAGMRFQFGADTLMDNDRRGATLDSPWAIPRWVAYSSGTLR